MTPPTSLDAIPHASSYAPPEPDFDALRARRDELIAAFEAAPDADARLAVLEAWNEVARDVGSWFAVQHLRFQQDTTDDEARAGRKRADTLGPVWTELDVGWKRAVLDSPHRDDVTAAHGPQLLALWSCDVEAFRPELRHSIIEEKELVADYIGELGGARIDVDGAEHSLSSLRTALVADDRGLRERAMRAKWAWFDERGATFDDLYDRLVALRTAQARTLGEETYVPVGYRRKRRVDYGPDDVERFRAAVRDDVVPLAAELVRRQADALGVDAVMPWDEKIHATAGPPKLVRDLDGMHAAADAMFAELSTPLSRCWQLMRDRGLLDLADRDGKAVGGFCTYFPTLGVPFIFANVVGVHDDVRTFTHEMGHAFQRFSSREQPLDDYVGCTSETAEIHSMSLEYLSWPWMDAFFGDDADAFRRSHLIDQLLFLPYGVAIDEFQHRVYANPDASPADRHAFWADLERTYMPWRTDAGIPFLAKGGAWQQQRHVYAYPFYYIDYTLAATCALQFWVRSRRDRAAAMVDYEHLCTRGGSAPFQQLAREAGLVSPFDDGCLRDVVAEAAKELGV